MVLSRKHRNAYKSIAMHPDEPKPIAKLLVTFISGFFFYYYFIENEHLHKYYPYNAKICFFSRFCVAIKKRGAIAICAEKSKNENREGTFHNNNKISWLCCSILNYNNLILYLAQICNIKRFTLIRMRYSY